MTMNDSDNDNNKPCSYNNNFNNYINDYSNIDGITMAKTIYVNGLLLLLIKLRCVRNIENSRLMTIT